MGKLTRTERFVLEFCRDNPDKTARQYPRPPWSIGTKSPAIGGARWRLLDRMEAKGLVGSDFRITPAGRAALDREAE